MKKVFLILLSVFSVLLFVSCGSKPAAEEKKPEAPVVETPAEEPEVVDEEISSQLDAEAQAELIAKIEDARKAAIEAGAEQTAPDQLKKIDDYYESVKNSDISSKADDLIARYKLLEDYTKAKSAKSEIDDNNFASYAQSNYDRGLASLEKVENAFSNDTDLDASISESATDAYSNFNSVLLTAYKRLAKDERSAAYEAKKNADSVKAGVAQKERYKAAAEDFKSGDSLYSMQNPKKAIEKYTSAKDEFNALYEEVSVKRAEAQAAIEAAKKRVAESAQMAESADAKAPITEPVEGIEDADTVLLEADNYEDPATAEVDIAAEIDDDGNAIEETPVVEDLANENAEDVSVEETKNEGSEALEEADDVENVENAEAEPVEAEAVDAAEEE